MNTFQSTGLPPNRAEAFWSKIRYEAGCWIWIGARASGYGRFYVRGRVYAAHRITYHELAGEVPAELELDHLCRNRACVNPYHLEAVTRRVNLQRSPVVRFKTAVQATECKRGHPYAGNTYWRKDGGRLCRTCVLASSRRSYQRKKWEVVQA